MNHDPTQLNSGIHPETDTPTQVPGRSTPSEASTQTSSDKSELFQAATMGLVGAEEDLVELAVVQPEDKALLRRFTLAAEAHAQEQGVADAWSVNDVAMEAEIELNAINRDSALNIAMWVVWLQVTARFMAQEELRYQTRSAFLENYPVFEEYPEDEQDKLWHTANWMNYLFSQIPAKKNKGLAIQITPKLVEGWHARYVTGSGQTKQTADRVHVYEIEGEIQPYQRVKMNKRKRPAKKGKAPKRRKRVFTLKRRRATRSRDAVVDTKPKRTALEAQDESRPRMEGVEYDEGEDYPALDFDTLDADHSLAEHPRATTAAAGGIPTAVPAYAAPALTPAPAPAPGYAASSPSFFSTAFPSRPGVFHFGMNNLTNDNTKDTEHPPVVTPTPAPAVHAAAPTFEDSKYSTSVPPHPRQRHRRQRPGADLSSYYDNDTSSESMDGDAEGFTSPIGPMMEHSFGGHIPEPHVAPELYPIGLARLPSWNPSDNPPLLPSGPPMTTMGLQAPSPRLVRLCSWGTTQPEPQIGDHTRNLQDLPAFPAARPNGYYSHNGNDLFGNDMDALELFLNSNFEVNDTL